MQQVNLYTEDFRPRRDPLALKNMLILLGVVAAIVGLYSGILIWREDTGWKALAEKQASNARLQDEVSRMQQDLEARARDTALQTEQKNLENRIANTEVLLAAIRSGLETEAEKTAFSEVLIALGEHKTDALWLEKISVLENGARLKLEGRTLKPEQLPGYLQALGNSGVFRGRAFNEFSLQLESVEGETAASEAEDDDGSRAFSVDTQSESERNRRNEELVDGGRR